MWKKLLPFFFFKGRWIYVHLWIGPHHLFGEREARKADSISKHKLPEGPPVEEKVVGALPHGLVKAKPKWQEIRLSSGQTLIMTASIKDARIEFKRWPHSHSRYALMWHHLIIQVVMFLLITNNQLVVRLGQQPILLISWSLIWNRIEELPYIFPILHASNHIDE